MPAGGTCVIALSPVTDAHVSLILYHEEVKLHKFIMSVLPVNGDGWNIAEPNIKPLFTAL